MTKIRLGLSQEALRLVSAILLSLFFHGFIASFLEKNIATEKFGGRQKPRQILVTLIQVTHVAPPVNTRATEKQTTEDSHPVPSLTPSPPVSEDSTEPEIFYIPSSLLDERPKLSKDIDYESADLMTIEGTGKVRFSLWIGPTGKVDFVDQEDSALSPEETKIISDLFKKLEFSPGKLREIAVPSLIQIEVNIPPLTPKKSTTR